MNNLGEKIRGLISRIQKTWNEVNNGGRILICCFAILALYAVNALLNGRILACIFLAIAAWLIYYALNIKRGKKTPKKSWAAKAAMISAAIIFLGCFIDFPDFNVDSINRNVEEPIATEFSEILVWPENELTDLLPKPVSRFGTVKYIHEGETCIFVARTEKNEYLEYVNACIEAGFGIDADQDGNRFTAQNENGYRLEIRYGDDKSMTITLGEPLYNLMLEVECVENWIFNTYDIEVYVNGTKTGTLLHGASDTYNLELKAGKYEIVFYSNESQDVKGKTDLDITCDVTASYKLYCSGNEIEVNAIYIDRDEKLNDDEIKMLCPSSDYINKDYKKVVLELKKLGFTNIKTKAIYDITLGLWYSSGETSDVTINEKSFSKGEVFAKDAKIVVSYHEDYSKDPSLNDSSDESSTNSKETVSYSTNDKSTVRNGNTGIYAYKNTGSQNAMGGWYDQYYIINFDEGYVYYFCEGYGSEKGVHNTCDKVKINSGTLNDRVVITYHDGSDVWSEGLYFKWSKQPDHLVMQDNDGFEYDFYATNLNEALALRNSKTIHNY